MLPSKRKTGALLCQLYTHFDVQTHSTYSREHSSLVRCRALPYVTAHSVYEGGAQSTRNWMASTDTERTLVDHKVACMRACVCACVFNVQTAPPCVVCKSLCVCVEPRGSWRAKAALLSKPSSDLSDCSGRCVWVLWMHEQRRCVSVSVWQR